MGQISSVFDWNLFNIIYELKQKQDKLTVLCDAYMNSHLKTNPIQSTLDFVKSVHLMITIAIVAGINYIYIRFIGCHTFTTATNQNDDSNQEIEYWPWSEGFIQAK